MQSNVGKGEESSMTEKIESIESGTPLPRPKDRFVGHLKRFWWIYFAIFVILALIIVLPIIYVGYPHKAQKDVNNSELEITALSLTSPTSNSVVLQQVSTLHSNSSFNPQLDAFNASLFLQGTEPNIKPFAFVNIPSVHSTGAAPVDFKQSLQLVDVDQFTDFAKLALSSEDFVFGINGRTGLHQSGLPKTTVTYSGFPKMKGLNGLKGFNITTFKISLTPNPDGSNLIGTVYVPNTSVMTLDLGNVTLRLSITGTPIGTALIPDLTLKPGNNTLDMRATTNTSVVLSKLGAFPSGVVPVDIVGSDCIYNGQHLTYYEEALKANPQKIGLNLTAAIASAGN